MGWNNLTAVERLVVVERWELSLETLRNDYRTGNLDPAEEYYYQQTCSWLEQLIDFHQRNFLGL